VAFVAQGAATDATDTRVYVRATPDGPLVDPDAGTLTLTINDPGGHLVLTLTESALVRVELGVFAYSWQTDDDQALGAYAFVWNAEVNGVALPPAVDEVEVIPAGSLSTVADGLVSLATAEAWLRVTPDSGGPNDTNVGRLLRAVSSEIRGRTRRPFEGVPTVYGIGRDGPLDRARPPAGAGGRRSRRAGVRVAALARRRRRQWARPHRPLAGSRARHLAHDRGDPGRCRAGVSRLDVRPLDEPHASAGREPQQRRCVRDLPPWSPAVRGRARPRRPHRDDRRRARLMIDHFLVTPLTIRRFTAAGSASPRGHRAQAWTDVTTVPGFVIERSGKEINGPDLGGTVVSDALIGVRADVDVTEQDRITDGSAVYELLAVRRIRDLDGREDHLELDARRVRA
jgi:head-tail adaptor